MARRSHLILPADTPAITEHTYSLWGDTPGPTTFTSGEAFTFSTEFKVTTGTWWVSAVRVWRGSWDMTGPVTGCVFRVDSATVGTLLAGSGVSFDWHGLGWQTAALATPAPVVTAQTYRVCVHSWGGSNSTVDYWTTGLGAFGRTSGPLFAPGRATSVGTDQGPFVAGTTLVFPTSDGLGVNWWVDVTVTDVDPATVGVSTLDSAAEDARREPRVTVVVDWDRTGTNPLQDVSAVVDGVAVQRSATGDLPDQIGLVEGPVSAQLRATLSGQLADGTDICDALSPYRSDSALYLVPLLGAPVTCDMGLVTDVGTEMERQFTGQLRSLRVDSASRTVALTALDGADGLRAPITLPAHAQNLTDVLASHHRLDIAPQAVIDFVLRRNGIHASPPVHEDCQISCTGHGWLAAEVGRSAVPRGVAADVDGEWWVDGPFDMLAVRGVWDGNGLYQEFFSEDPFTPAGGTGIGMSAWVRAGTGMGVTAGTREMFQLFPLVNHATWKYEFYITDTGSLGGVIDIGGVNSGFAQSIGTSNQWMYLGLHFQHNTDGTTTIRYRQNGVTTAGNITTPALTSTVAPHLQVTAWTNGRDWSNFQVWYSAAPPSGSWPGEVHTPQARIDPGLNRLSHLPDVVNRPSWDVIKDVAGAEYGLAGFGPTGQFRFQERTTASDPTSVERTVTSARALIDLATSMATDSVRNVVTWETTAAYLDFATVIVEARDVTEFQSPVGIWAYEVPLEHGAIGTTTMEIPQVASAAWTDDYLWGFVAVRADSPSTEITAGLVRVLFTMAADRLGLITVYNYSSWGARFATTGGSPALRVQGWGLVEDPARLGEVRSTGSAALYGERALPISASPWRQLPTSLGVVAGGLLSSLSSPRPALPGVEVTGHPGTGIGATLRLVDDRGHGSMRANVIKLDRGFSGSKLTDHLGLRPVNPPGLGISDDTELGLADSTLIAGP